MTGLRQWRVGLCLVSLLLASCGLKGEPETPPSEETAPER